MKSQYPKNSLYREFEMFRSVKILPNCIKLFNGDSIWWLENKDKSIKFKLNFILSNYSHKKIISQIGRKEERKQKEKKDVFVILT